MKISEIKAQLNENPTESFINELQDDPRKGVQTGPSKLFSPEET